MIIFTEVLQHGTLPWTAEHDRRSILWRYSPGNMSFHPSGYSVKEHSFQRHWSEHLHHWPEEWYEGLDEAGQSVLEPACKRQDIAASLVNLPRLVLRRNLSAEIHESPAS